MPHLQVHAADRLNTKLINWPVIARFCLMGIPEKLLKMVTSSAADALSPSLPP